MDDVDQPLEGTAGTPAIFQGVGGKAGNQKVEGKASGLMLAVPMGASTGGYPQ